MSNVIPFQRKKPKRLDVFKMQFKWRMEDFERRARMRRMEREACKRALTEILWCCGLLLAFVVALLGTLYIGQ